MSVAQLSRSQVHILKALASVPFGMTRDQIEEKLDITVSTDVIGPVYSEDLYKHPDSLYALGCVSPTREEDDTKARWRITKDGKQIADKVKTRKPSSAVVPGDVLDPVVIAFRPTRTYTAERYTDEDMKEIRSKLGDRYANVCLDSLRQQIVNRRKMGKYNPIQSVPVWYTEYRNSQHWTALVQEMTEHHSCAVNPEHSEGINVYHRRFKRNDESVINNETPKDLIVLCASCRKKLSGSLPETPAEMP